MEQWQRQFIRGLFPYSASRLRIEHAFLAKHPHVPAFLYKYREFKKQHLEALQRGVLFMSSPDRFNDPFDTTVYFDPSRFVVEDLTAEEMLERIEEARAGNIRYPKVIEKPIRQDEWRRRRINELFKSERPDIRDAIIAAADEVEKEGHEKLRDKMRSEFRSGYSVLSLSANPTSLLMWSHYSSSHQGFCIEYDFGSLAPDDLRRRLCFPVLYRRKMTDATRYLANTGGGNLNNLFGQYLCLLKSADWAYEKEWRIVHAIGPSEANRKIHMPKPSAIILGSVAKPEDIKWMEEFCGLNSLTLKRARRSHTSPEIIV
jgi:hypothetical protein